MLIYLDVDSSIEIKISGASTLAQALDFVPAISYPFAFAPTDRQFIHKHKHSMAAIRLVEIDL